MSIKSTSLTAAAALAVATGVSTVATQPANAATPECGPPPCISIFSRQFGSNGDPNFVEAVLGGEAKVGQPLILKAASGSDPSEDLVPRVEGDGTVAALHGAGMVSAAVNRHYGTLQAAQIEYAPRGRRTELCVGLTTDAYQGQGLTLQPCSVPGRTVWIVDAAFSPDTALDGYLPIVNGSTTNFSRPYAMDFPHRAHPTDEPTPHIQVRHLQYTGKTHSLSDRQLWGFHFGVIAGGE